MKPKTLGLAAIAAVAFTAFVASSASATTLELGGTIQNKAVTIDASISAGTSAVLSRTDNTLANTCTVSTAAGTTEKDEGGQGDFTGPTVTGALSTLSFSNCERAVTVHKAGTLHVEYRSVTDGTVMSSGAEVTVNTPFGTVNCKTGAGTDLGILTGVDGTPNEHAEIHLNAVINCGILLPSARWKGTYVVTSPTYLGVVS